MKANNPLSTWLPILFSRPRSKVPTAKIFGDIEDLIQNEYNQVEGVIIGVGGLLGVGEKRTDVR